MINPLKTEQMKKIIIIAAALMIVLSAISCSKERKCRCVSPTSADTVYFTVKSSTKCTKVTAMGMEVRNTDGSYSNTLHNVDCVDAPEY